MREEVLNTLLLRSVSDKEYNRLLQEIDLKKKLLEQISVELQNNSTSKELSIGYLLQKREIERIERIQRIIKRERIREIETNRIKSEYLAKYQKIENKYKEYYCTLNFNNREVPVEHYVHVQVIEECGLIEMDNDLIETQKNSLYYLRKKDIQHLIYQGKMKVVHKGI
ncbi:hypothetical protein NEOKW01_0364 [Nematocida sp. AWRm80]|nr:hypothetical protein NEOKW01_0364 [Nematocida sp. AWRm80]